MGKPGESQDVGRFPAVTRLPLFSCRDVSGGYMRSSNESRFSPSLGAVNRGLEESFAHPALADTGFPGSDCRYRFTAQELTKGQPELNYLVVKYILLPSPA